MIDTSMKEHLVHPKENVYFALTILISVLSYIFLAFSVIGVLIVALLIVASLLFHGLMMASYRRNGVKLGKRQFPEIYEMAVQVAADMGLKKIPDIYVIESEGMLNAFATRFFGKNIVVVYSGIFELIERGAKDEVMFVLAHEFAHLKRRHVTIGFLLLPAMWVPFIGDAYLRACEYTCDRYAAFYINSFPASKNALTMLAIGKDLYPKVNQETYMEQIQSEFGFFAWLHEKLSTHPHLPKRLYALSLFFDKEQTSIMKEPKQKVFVGLLASFAVGIILSVSVWFGFQAIQKLDLWSEAMLDVEGATPLMKAASENDISKMAMLLEEGADIQSQDSEGSSALHWAIYDGSLEAAEFLIDNGAEINQTDAYDSTPLMAAVFSEDIEMVKLLLKNGADPAYVDAEGNSAYDYALEYENKEMAELLKSR